MGAGGQIGQSQVYARWKGIPYARRYVVPANPNTTAQQLTRQVFRAADQQWKYLGALAQAPFVAAVKGRPMVPRNLLMKTEIPLVRSETDISNWVFSPGNGGGIAPQSVTASVSGGAGQIVVTVTPPDVPVGWTLTAAHAAAILQRAPDAMPDEQDVEGSAAASPWEITLSGLTGSQEYVVGGWLEWVRTDGTTIYGRSITTTATPT
jgi:hypothetical protein